MSSAADSMEAELVSLTSPDLYLKQPAAAIVSAKDLRAFLSSTATNSTLQQLVKGVLVDPTGKKMQLMQNDQTCIRCLLGVPFHCLMTSWACDTKLPSSLLSCHKITSLLRQI